MVVKKQCWKPFQKIDIIWDYQLEWQMERKGRGGRGSREEIRIRYKQENSCHLLTEVGPWLELAASEY
jgi:hypothetical protein